MQISRFLRKSIVPSRRILSMLTPRLPHFEDHELVEASMVSYSLFADSLSKLSSDTQLTDSWLTLCSNTIICWNHPTSCRPCGKQLPSASPTRSVWNWLPAISNMAHTRFVRICAAIYGKFCQTDSKQICWKIGVSFMQYDHWIQTTTNCLTSTGTKLPSWLQPTIQKEWKFHRPRHICCSSRITICTSTTICPVHIGIMASNSSFVVFSSMIYSLAWAI